MNHAGGRRSLRLAAARVSTFDREETSGNRAECPESLGAEEGVLGKHGGSHSDRPGGGCQWPSGRQNVSIPFSSLWKLGLADLQEVLEIRAITQAIEDFGIPQSLNSCLVRESTRGVGWRAK